MSDALKRGTVEHAEWLADKLHNTNDYGKEAAYLLVKQATELEALREDAARYRKIRNIAVHGPFECQNYEYGWLEVSGQHEPGFDSAVDAAMENTK